MREGGRVGEREGGRERRQVEREGVESEKYCMFPPSLTEAQRNNMLLMTMQKGSILDKSSVR